MTAHFRYRQPPTIEHPLTIEAPGVCIDAMGTYCTDSGELLTLTLETVGLRGKVTRHALDPDAIAALFGDWIGRSWRLLDADTLADVLQADAEGQAGDWADWRYDLAREAAE
jgi:hypothetical protein